MKTKSHVLSSLLLIYHFEQIFYILHCDSGDTKKYVLLLLMRLYNINVNSRNGDFCLNVFVSCFE